MHWLDWTIVAVFIAGLSLAVTLTGRCTKSVSDFLAAGRAGGRYIICMAEGASSIGAITIIAFFEMYYNGGFAIYWWSYVLFIVTMIISLSGWITYRYRRSRVLTMAQFFEVRYSRRFRIFVGTIAWLSGIVNFGLFPAIGARFFINYCALPEQFGVAGIIISTYAVVMIILLAVALFFTFVGGQTAIILTDFLQGMFTNIVCLAIVLFLLTQVSWTQIFEATRSAPAGASLVHPFHTENVSDFNMWYYLLLAFITVYGFMAWQGSQGYNASAKSPHEARMSKVVATYRGFASLVLFMLVPIIAYTVLHHANFTTLAAEINSSLGRIDNDAVRKQMTVPMVLVHMLPKGLIGAFAAIMLAAFIATCDTYMHSWGSIFVQDILMPLRGKPFSPKAHMLALRLSITFVAVFSFLFSLLYRQIDYIFMFFAITGAIFLSGAGAVIIGGFYWKKGTTAAAYGAMISGTLVAVGQLVADQICDYYGIKYPINGIWQAFVSSAVAIIIYVIISLIQNKEYDLDMVLRRNEYAMVEDEVMASKNIIIGWRKRLGITNEFTFGDKIIYYGSILWTLIWGIIFVIGTIWNLLTDVSERAWEKYWFIISIINIVAGIVTTVWIGIGGFKDLWLMYRNLLTEKVDSSDDGWIKDNWQ